MSEVQSPPRGGIRPRRRRSTRPLLEVDNLHTHFFTAAGVVRAVDGVSYSRRAAARRWAWSANPAAARASPRCPSCGWSPSPPGRIVDGAIRFEGTDLLGLTESQMEDIRGNDISMIFQEPMTSLNPLLTAGQQISEAIALHQGLSRREAMDRAMDMLRRVHIPEPERRAQAYPHQLSGGMRQRVMIAMALSCNPKVLIADEPTTALDVTIQAQILDLMRELRDTLGTAMILITHDMGVVAENADRVVVMYAGRKVEEATGRRSVRASGASLHARPARFDSASRSRGARRSKPRSRLNEIKGMVPSLSNLPQGCTFAPRCGFATDQCRAAYPPLEQHATRPWVACWHAERLLGGAA